MLKKIRTRKRFGLLAGVALLALMLAACGSSTVTSSTVSTGGSTLTNTMSNTGTLAVLPILQQSLQATMQLKTVHVDLQGSGTLQTNGQLLPALAQATAFRVQSSANLDIAGRAGTARSTFTLLPAQQPALVSHDAARLVNGQVYVRAPSRQWFVLNLGSALAFLSAHATLVQISPQALLSIMQHVTITDAGEVTINGQQARHVTLSIDQGAWGQLANTAGLSQQVQQVAASIQLLRTLQADLFIDTATFHLVRVEIQGKVQVQLDSLLAAAMHIGTTQGAIARQITLGFDLRLNLSQFNQPIAKVTVPPNALPFDPFSQAIGQLMGQ
jgi:hypothetical protein